MKKGITVLICTYNGAERLPQTIEHLARQIVNSDTNWEIIIVDNASTDNTCSIAENEWKKYNLPDIGFRLKTESRPGKINALETGALLSKYEYLIICDDDNWLYPDYVQSVYDILEHDASIGAVGGESIAINDSGKYPEWFEQHKTSYAIGKQGLGKGNVTPRGYLFGAGLGTRTKLYLEIYQQFPSFLIGRQGEKLTAGEDTEYCQRLILKGYKLFYDPKLIFNHYLPAYRLKVAYRDALNKGLAESDEILGKYYLITRLKLKITTNPLNKLRLLFVSPLRALCSFSKKKRNYEMNIVMYLLGIKSGNDPIFEAIRTFEKETKKFIQ